MTTLVCRRLGAADLPTVLQLYATASGPDPRWLARFANDPTARIWVASQAVNAPAIGVAWFRVVVGEAELIDLRVQVDARGQGVGAALLRKGLEALTAERVRCCHLEVRVSNERAQRLYRRLGFVETGRRRDYYPSEDRTHGREDAILMGWQWDSGASPP